MLVRSLSVAALATALAFPSFAQSIPAELPDLAKLNLPDSPGTFLSTSQPSSPFVMADPGQAVQKTSSQAPRYHRVIKPYESAVDLTASNKIVLSLRENVTLTNVGVSLLSAGYSHLLDNRPHFGTDRAGFGERFGSSMLQGGVQNIMSHGVYANIFREDPRYYIKGASSGVVSRAIYAGSRTFITRRDSGKHGFNFSNILGIASAAAVTNGYYPHQDRGFAPTARSFATSLVTNIGGNEVREFLGDAIRIVTHRK